MEILSLAMKEWVKIYKKNAVKYSSYIRLLNSIQLIDKYFIGKIPLDKLVSDDIQIYLNQLVEDNYSRETISKQLGILRNFIDYCNDNAYTSLHIRRSIKVPKESVVKKHKREIIAYNSCEQRSLMNVFWTGEHDLYFCGILMLETGIRIGEALALSWTDVDWDRRALKVHKTIIRGAVSRELYIQKETKTKTSNRVIPLSSAALDALKEMWKRTGVRDGYVFCDTFGNPLTYDDARWWIRKACKKADVEYYGQHVFRHTFATNCYYKGCDVKLLSKFLGHSDVSITYDTYIHLYGDALEQMRTILD